MFGTAHTCFWIEAALAVFTAVHSVVTLVSREWIEFLFGVDPAGGSGAFDWGTVAVLLVASVTFSARAHAEWKEHGAVAAYIESLEGQMARSSRTHDEEPREGDDKQTPPPRPTEPKQGNPDADPVRIHREYVERRLGGGAPATPEAYARALEQWHQLPGAVSTPPSDVRGADAQSPPEEEDGPQSEDASPNEKDRL